MEICSSVVAGWIINFCLFSGVWTAKNSTQIARATQTPPEKNGKFQINTQSDQRKNTSHSSERFSTRGDREWLNSSRVNHSHICILTVLSGMLRARPLISARLRNQEWHWYGGKSRSKDISSKNCEFKRSAMKLNSAIVATSDPCRRFSRAMLQTSYWVSGNFKRFLTAAKIFYFFFHLLRFSFGDLAFIFLTYSCNLSIQWWSSDDCLAWNDEIRSVLWESLTLSGKVIN